MKRYIIDKEYNKFLNHDIIDFSEIYYFNSLFEEADLDIVRHVIYHGINLDTISNLAGQSALHTACQLRIEIVHFLVEMGADIEVNDIERNTPLFYACLAGKIDIVKFLIDSGANINHINTKKQNIAHIACCYNQVRMIEYLVENEININWNLQEFNNEQPIHYACRYCDFSTIKKIIDIGIDLEGVNTGGNKPLHIACRRKYPELVKYLLDMGVDIYSENLDKQIPVFVLCVTNFYLKKYFTYDNFNNFNIQDVYPDNSMLDLLKCFIDHGFNPEFKNSLRQKLVHYACQYSNLIIVKYLIDNQLDLESKDVWNYNPVYYAMFSNNYEIFKEVVQHVNLESNIGKGNKLVHYACAMLDVQYLQLLLDYEVDCTYIDKNGLKPIDFAIKYNNTVAIELLAKYGIIL